MNVSEVVEEAKGGDVDAFSTLVRRYQTMAFGYAYATLGDFHLAEDAAQQAFIVAYRNLTSLRHPERFGGWLRGIVRFECLHLMRNRYDRHVSIDDATDIAASTPGPTEVAEQRESFDRALAAVQALPEPERVAAVLYYIHDHSQRDVAQFLNLPVSTVNNRLRTARQYLRTGGLLTMTRDAFRQHDLPEDFAGRIGKVVRSEGPIVDARFASDQRPSILNAVTITDDASGLTLAAQVAQYLDDDLVRLISMGSPDPGISAVQPGMRVLDTREPVSLPLDDVTLRRLIAKMRRSGMAREIVETGIKAIDVFCPLPAGGLVGLAGDMQTGKMVLVEELIHRLSDTSPSLSILVFVQAPTEVTTVQELEYRTSGSVEAIYLPVADASPEALAHVTEHLDAVITVSSRMADAELYPAIDPLRSTSDLLDQAIAGSEQADVAAGVKRLLRQAFAEHVDADATINVRARQIQKFLAQPFFVAEAFTNRAGKSVPRAAALSGCRALLEGTHIDIDESTLYMTGTLDEALGRE